MSETAHVLVEGTAELLRPDDRLHVPDVHPLATRLDEASGADGEALGELQDPGIDIAVIETEDLRDSVLTLFLVEGQSHPFNVVRASELRRWTESGEYTTILGGTYPRREGDSTGWIAAGLLVVVMGSAVAATRARRLSV